MSFFRGHLLNVLGAALSFRGRRKSAAAIAPLKIEELSSLRMVGFPVREASARIRKASAQLLNHLVDVLQGSLPAAVFQPPAIDLPLKRTYHRRQ